MEVEKLPKVYFLYPQIRLNDKIFSFFEIIFQIHFYNPINNYI